MNTQEPANTPIPPSEPVQADPAPVTKADQIAKQTIGKFESLIEQKNASLMAQTAPLPGPTFPAFVDGPIIVGEHTVRSLVKADFRLFQMSENWVLKWLAEAAKPKEDRNEIPDDPDSDNMLVWQLTHPVRLVEQELKKGLTAFKDKCRQETEHVLPSHIYDFLLTAAWEQLSRSQLTVLKFLQKEQEAENRDPFPVLSGLMVNLSQSKTSKSPEN